MLAPALVMLLHVLSDIHIEFEAFEVPRTDADVIVLAGDIGAGMKVIEFAKSACHGLPVIFVPGNHEYYDGAIPKLTTELRDAARGSDVHVLEEDEVVIGGVRFLGTTLWTDWDLYGDEDAPRAMEDARAGMLDYRLIRKSPGYSRLSPRDTLAFHRRARAWLREKLAQPHSPTVVVTHHGVSLQSSHPHHKEDGLAPAFLSNLESMMGNCELWIHGHTHHSVDYEINGTRVVSNQRGYPHEATGFDPELVVEVDTGG